MYIHGTLHPDRVMDEHDFVYIVEGYWEIYQNGIPYNLHQDDVILLHAGEHHYGLTPCTPNTKTMYIHVKSDKQDSSVSRQKTDMGSQIELDSIIHCQGYFGIKSIFKDIISSYWSDSLHKESKLASLFNLLLCEFHECLSNSKINQLNVNDKILQLLQENPQKFFTSKELSDIFFICERTLVNQFKNKYGKSLYHYQFETKLEAVRLFMLSHPNIKLYEVAINFGFYDEFHLSKSFKKIFGISPKHYKSYELINNQK